MALIFDLEADNLVRDATKIHCIVTKDTETQDVISYGPDSIKEGLLALYNANTIIGHNICGYDVPLIQKFYPRWKHSDLVDTLILSRLYMPEKQSHSLDSYGKKFKRAKPVHEDWSVFSPEMLHRCMEDVEINDMLYKYLMKKEDYGKWREAIKLEQSVSYFHTLQTIEGVDIDINLAKATISKIDSEMEVIESELLEQIPWKCKMYGSVPVNKPFLKSGDYSKAVKDWYPDDVPNVMSSFTRIVFSPISLTSHIDVKDFLFTQGWKPTTYNYKREADGSLTQTSPKLTEDSYDSIKGDLGKKVAYLNTIRHRRNTIKNFKDPENKGILSKVREDGRVPAEANTVGTPTARYKHSGAVCNVPKFMKDKEGNETSVYGKAMRSIFCVKPPYVWVGADLSAIEARILGHYTSAYDGGTYAEELLDGDIHSKNASLIRRDRDTAKTFLYALMYGAGVAKLASILTCSTNQATKLINEFWDGNPSLKALVDDLNNYYKVHNNIKGLDGRTLFIRSTHKLLNSLIQSAAAIVFKRWLVSANKKIREEGLDCRMMISYHDEINFRCNIKDIDRVTEVLMNTCIGAGEYYNLKVPVGTEVLVGSNWFECH